MLTTLDVNDAAEEAAGNSQRIKCFVRFREYDAEDSDKCGRSREGYPFPGPRMRANRSGHSVPLPPVRTETLSGSARRGQTASEFY